MEQNTFTLLATTVLGAIATLFTIIAVATPGWAGGVQLFRCGIFCNSNYTAAGVLLILGIFFLALAIVLTLMFWRGLISNASDKVKSIVLVFFIMATIFIIIAYSRTVNSHVYSYHLAATAGILAFLSTVFFTYWLGRTSVTFRP